MRALVLGEHLGELAAGAQRGAEHPLEHIGLDYISVRPSSSLHSLRRQSGDPVAEPTEKVRPGPAWQSPLSGAPHEPSNQP